MTYSVITLRFPASDGVLIDKTSADPETPNLPRFKTETKYSHGKQQKVTNYSLQISSSVLVQKLRLCSMYVYLYYKMSRITKEVRVVTSFNKYM